MKHLTKLASPGRLIAFLLTLAGIYYVWGLVFTPGGTGSNVVLGLLMALAALYLVTANLGALLDDVLFSRLDRETSELVRWSETLEQDAVHALKRAAKGKVRLADKDQESLQEALGAVKAAREGVLARDDDGKPAGAKIEQLKKACERLERETQAVLGSARQGSVLGQLRSLGVAFAIALALRAFVVEPFQIPSSSMIPTLLIGDHLFVARFWYGLSIPFMSEPRYFARWSEPDPGDVIVFVAPPWVGQNAGEDWIKRVIAGAGQSVRMRDGVLYVDGAPYSREEVGEGVKYQDYDEHSNRWHTSRARHFRESIGERSHSVFVSTPTKSDWPSSPAGQRPQLSGLTCDQNQCTVNEGFVFVMGDNRDNSSDGRVWGAVPIDNVKGRALFIWMSVDGSERSVELGRFTLPAFRWERLFQAIE